MKSQSTISEVLSACLLSLPDFGDCPKWHHVEPPLVEGSIISYQNKICLRRY